mmetsp:Transcript_74072/g.205800  ORF Transcript_74072/g.205800 Transcript_74072/m.205800 type:complete len:295 (-) Transcript_74072:250-1134(-)
MTKSDLSKPGRENWVADSAASHCRACDVAFGLLTRRHHCRSCGDIFCGRCSSFRIAVDRSHYEDGEHKAKRVCSRCYMTIKRSREKKKAAALLENDRPIDSRLFPMMAAVEEGARSSSVAEQPGDSSLRQPEASGGAPSSDDEENLTTAPDPTQEGRGRALTTATPACRAAPLRHTASLPASSGVAAGDLVGPDWDEFSDAQPSLADAIKTCQEAVASVRDFENRGEAVFQELRRSVLACAKHDQAALPDAPGKAHVWNFLGRFANTRFIYRRQVAEVVAVLESSPPWVAAKTV